MNGGIRKLVLALAALALAAPAVGAPPTPQRLDPYKNFRFRLVFEGRPVAGVSLVTPATPPADYRQGGSHGPATRRVGRAPFEAITLERGVTQDGGFASWAGHVQSSGAAAPPPAARRTLTIQLMNEAGQPVTTWTFVGCWSARYQALPDLDQGANAVAIQHIKLECEGWTQDPPVGEPRP